MGEQGGGLSDQSQLGQAARVVRDSEQTGANGNVDLSWLWVGPVINIKYPPRNLCAQGEAGGS